MTTKENFFTATRGIFSECNTPESTPDYVSLDKRSGRVSSKYWYTETGVIRQSDHWGEVASCIWTLKGTTKVFSFCQVFKEEKTGYCSFENLFNTTEKFQQIVENGVKKYKDTLENMADFDHRNAANFYWDNLTELFEIN